MARIGPTMGMKPLWAFFFSTRENLVGGIWIEETMAVCHVILTKRDSRGCGKRNSLGTGWENVEGLENPRKIKLAHDEY
jgi:hypothetical protein